VLLAVEAAAVKEDSGSLLSRLVLGRAITACVIKVGIVEVDSRLCCQGGCGFLKQVRSGFAAGPDSGRHGSL
jgi:hypothetical protein